MKAATYSVQYLPVVRSTTERTVITNHTPIIISGTDFLAMEDFVEWEGQNTVKAEQNEHSQQREE